jgi:hypothetical protein
LTTAASVFSAVCSLSSAAPSTSRAEVQAIASETPGGLVSPSLRSRPIAVATSPASGRDAPGTRRRMMRVTRDTSGYAIQW